MECDHQHKYLGLPFCKGNSKKAAFKEIVEKLKSKLSGWKQKALSQAGRGVLIKSVTQALPLHFMQTFLLPVSVCDQLDKVTRDFWWGVKADEKKHLYLKAWDSICSPKAAGGLGFRKAREFNRSLITKLGWQLYTAPHKT